uniref:Ribosomal protein mS38 C-terminal domain-containing protein n=1 Tax=Arion vulgaris TaxID=1028688 RepID=A0A0B7A2Y9_9EUPU
MALCRFGLLRSCSHLQVSPLSLVALKPPGSILYDATQDRHSKTKLQHLNLMPLQCLNEGTKVTARATRFSTWRTGIISQPKTLPGIILESFHISPKFNASRDVQKYICPSRLLNNDVNLVILDNVTSITNYYDCPVSTIIDNMKMPSQEKSEISDGPGKNAPKMEAKIIMKIRHRKMKKHKLKKLRKRMYHLWRRHKLARRARRMKIYLKELEEIKKTGEVFNALEFVQQQIAKAKKGGYGLNRQDETKA